MIYDKPEEYTEFERQQAYPFSSLIERVMDNDFYKFQNDILNCLFTALR